MFSYPVLRPSSQERTAQKISKVFLHQKAPLLLKVTKKYAWYGQEFDLRLSKDTLSSQEYQAHEEKIARESCVFLSVQIH